MKNLKSKLNEMQRFYNVPQNVAQLHQEESAQKNSITMKILAALIIIVEIFNISRVLFFTNAKLSTLNNQIYFTMYLTLLTSAIIFCFIDWLLKSKHKERMRLYVFITYFWMFWHIILNCYDLSRNQNGDITIFSCAVLGLAIFAQMKPRHTLTIATLSYFMLLILSGGALDTGGYINATISLILACLIALRVYTLSMVQIYQHIELAEKSEQLQKERAELKSNLEKYEMVLNNTNDHIFEIDFLKEQLVFAQNSHIAKHYGREISNLTEWLRTQTVIYPEFTDQLIHGLHELVTTKQDADYTFRMYSKTSTDKWYRLRVFVNQNNDDTTLTGIGILSDIDVQQKQVESLTSQTKTDAMTGLLNALAFQNNYNIARSNLAELDYLVMFMIDLDNFKLINDTYGHFAGDCVLKEVAHVLSSTFRDYDCCARLGGDEFAVLMKNVKDASTIKMKAEQLTCEMSKIAVTEHKIQVTCSIGIAVTNNKQTHYDEIYKHADKALYDAKDCGKGCYKIIN